MRWTPKEKPEWRPFFAFIPMKVDGVMVWMEWVETKLTAVGGDVGNIFRLPPEPDPPTMNFKPIDREG